MTGPAATIWTSSNAVPQTQNTAPVLEFRCLYTSDLRRKQKRWQDGRLKFHTFNKRIMVYDDRSNFVGDSHWREDYAVAEGEEVELERCGILVEVSECVGAREQDLTLLLNRGVKDRQERVPVRAAASLPLQYPSSTVRIQAVGLPLAEPTNPRLAKRRKPNKSPSSKNGYAQSLTGATLALSGTPSTVAPLRYDPLWLRTLKQPIERVDLSDSGEVPHRHPEQRVTKSINQSRAGGYQAKRMSTRLSPKRVDSGYVRNIAGAAPVLASKTLTSCGPPPTSVIVNRLATLLGESSATTREDEFIDIDVYDKENFRIEGTSRSSYQVADLAKIRQERQLLESLSPKPYAERDRHERPFNPLRIKTRPKRKLLLTVNHGTRPPWFTEPGVEQGNEEICPPKSSKGSGETLLSKATVRRVAPVIEDAQFNIKEHHSSAPVHGGIDYHNIDVRLARKVMSRTSMAEKQHQYVQAHFENRSFTQPAKRSKEPTGLEVQEGDLFKHIPDLQLEIKRKIVPSPRQPLILCGNNDTETGRVRTRISMNSSISPPGLASFREGAQDCELYRVTAATTIGQNINTQNPTYQADKGVVLKRDVIPFKLPAKLTGPRTQMNKEAQKEGGHDENILPLMIESFKPAIPVTKTKMSHQHAVANRDQGPWSREAFDLFDWRPGSGTMSNSFAAG